MITRQDCLGHLKSLDVDYDLVEHKAVYTIKEAMAELPGREEIKNLFISDNKSRRFYLVVMPGTKKLDLSKLATDLGEKKISFVSERRLLEMLGVKSGSVSLFCCLNPNSKDVKVVFDKDLLKYKELGFHPIVNTATVFIDSKEADLLLGSFGREVSLLKL